ncbi:hypothetical protein BDEG_28371 [Batrachochytrium dendrobatidis JEL423]|uniref:Vacuolar protein sorting-associated protein 16 homolog n=1 Tax=Batrachochytrium dendrobatidis (strain JEL423) TaxID=403673 RepID=A0A177WYL9_BATDL|nr:hypothetical protein BDEG_28371 [Batrachochytrium dendrobatidis JEL423]
MGWTLKERLVCVMEYGSLRLYDLQGDFVQITLGEEAKENGVLDAHVWENSAVILTTNLKLILVANLDEPRPILLANPGLVQPPHSWSFISATYSLSKHVEILLAVNNTIVVVDAKNAQDQMLQQGPFTRMAVSPNAKFLALFTANGRYAHEGVVHIVNEIDCARIISNTRCELLERVPVVTETIFRIGSTAPGAILFDAREHFEKQSPKCDENIRSIRGQLMEAVTSCIDGACNEFDIQLQKALLRAASFGKAYLDSFSADRFVKACQSIRVLNALHNNQIGIPLTYKQYQHISPEGLIDRLINRREHLLARRICEYLRMPIDRVLIDWARVKVKQSTDDEETVCRMIVEKMNDRPGISFAEIAKAAYAVGRIKLATKLLDFEPSPSDQVPLLLSMQQDESALTKAVESFDTDLVYLVVLHMKRKLPLADFFRIISTKPLACNLLELYAREQDPQLLYDFYYQDDRRVSSANLILDESCADKARDIPSRLLKLKKAIKLYGEEKESIFETKSLEDQSKLLQIQSTLERELTGQTFLDLSVTDTVFKCLILGHMSRALKIKSDLKMDDRRFAWLELRAIIQNETWEALDKFAKSNPKFGHKHVVESLLEAGHGFRAELFVESLGRSISTVAHGELKAHIANLQQPGVTDVRT